MSVKFRNPKTGEILNDYVAFRGDFCCEYSCDICPVGKKTVNGLCQKWIHEHPYEAAKLMGYEVVEENEMNTDRPNKPLKDWTLGECKAFCAAQLDDCPADCPLDGVCGLFVADEWDLRDSKTPDAKHKGMTYKDVANIFDLKRVVMRCGKSNTTTASVDKLP